MDVPTVLAITARRSIPLCIRSDSLTLRVTAIDRFWRLLSQARVRGKFTSRQCRRFAEGLLVSYREAGERHRTEENGGHGRSRGDVVGRGQAGSAGSDGIRCLVNFG